MIRSAGWLTLCLVVRLQLESLECPRAPLELSGSEHSCIHRLKTNGGWL
jgi:hypothetical protein